MAKRWRSSSTSSPPTPISRPRYYYLGRTRQELKSSRYAEAYRDYLALRGGSKEDVLLPEVRKRAGV